MLVIGGLGLGAGVWFAFTHRQFDLRLGRSPFWSNLRAFPSQLLAVDAAEMTKLYGQLGKDLFAYLGRLFALLSIGLLPAFLVLLMLSGYPAFVYDTSARTVSIHGSQAETLYRRLVSTASVLPSTRPPDIQPDSIEIHAYAQDALAYTKTAFCPTSFNASLYMLMLFRTESLEGPGITGQHCVVVRPDQFDRNVLWPVLDDLEFAFFLTLILGSVLFKLLLGRKGTAGEG